MQKPVVNVMSQHQHATTNPQFNSFCHFKIFAKQGRHKTWLMTCSWPKSLLSFLFGAHCTDFVSVVILSESSQGHGAVVLTVSVGSLAAT